MGDHAIRWNSYRYIRYNDGSEEFYDHKTDPHEWQNLANTKMQKNKIKKLIKFIPQQNAPYAEHSFYHYNPYFINDKLNHSK